MLLVLQLVLTLNPNVVYAAYHIFLKGFPNIFGLDEDH